MTQAPTATATETETATPVPTATAAPSATPTNTSTPSPEPTGAATAEPTETATTMATTLPTSTTAPTATATPTATVSVAPVNTATATPTAAEPEAATSTAPPVTTATPAPPSPTATATSDASVIYSIGEGGDFSTWTVPNGWSIAGDLRSNGEGGGGWALPPVTVTGITNYAVEIDVTVGESDQCPRNFGVAIRGSDAGYYAAGIEWDCEAMAMIWAGQERLATESVDFALSPHVLRIEAVGDRITFLVDGQLVHETTDSTFATGSEVGIWSNGVPLTITGVRILDVSNGLNGR